MADIKIAPSILAADFALLGEEVKHADEAGADYIHIDVMDGHFVPNISFGLPVIKSIRKWSKKPFDVHLMIKPTESLLELFASAGADIITVHVESDPHIHRLIQLIKNMDKKAGIALNPGTPPSAIEAILPDVDLVCVMTVNPGFGGQKFIKSQLDKIRTLRTMIEATGKDIDLEVDGGIYDYSAPKAIEAGANVLVAGTAIFSESQNNYAKAIEILRSGT